MKTAFRYIFFAIFSLFCPHLTFAQSTIPVDSWRIHATYFDGLNVAAVENKIYCSSSNGFFYYNKENNTIKTLSKLDDFSDIGISHLNYWKELNLLFIGYKNGNIDIFNPLEEQIVNIRTILNYANLTEKTIYHASFYDKLAYFSTAFGIVVIDCEKFVVREDFSNIGTNGKRIAVFSTAIFQGKLYAATAEGLKFCNLANNTICKDFANWQNVSFTTGKNVTSLAVLGNELLVGIEKDALYRFNGTSEQSLGLANTQKFYSLKNIGKKAAVCTENGLFEISESFLINQINISIAPKIRDASLDSEGKWWIADAQKGLVGGETNNFKLYTPTGTYSSDVFSLKYKGGRITALSGAFDKSMFGANNKNGFYLFKEGQWTNFNVEGLGEKIPDMRDFVASAYSPSEGKYYFGSFQDGILVWNPKDNTFSRINDSNSPLPNNKIVGLDVDTNGNLWIACYGVNSGENGYFKRTKDGQWQGFSFPAIGSLFPKNLMTDLYGNVFVALSEILGGGLMVFDSKGNYRVLNEEASNGRLISGLINDMALDNNGNVWLATNKGLGILYFTNRIFSADFEAQRPYYKNRPTLSSEYISSVAIDGANRAWIGTKNGVWLFGEDGSKLFDNFTSENSPLLSNEVLKIAANQNDGEVFFATDRGMISYRGKATSPASSFANANVFPNPVRPEYQGLITISGLKNASNVKITDASGRLAYETYAQGGMATWNGINYKNEKVLPGVYLVFCTDKNGEETLVTKIAILRD